MRFSFTTARRSSLPLVLGIALLALIGCQSTVGPETETASYTGDIFAVGTSPSSFGLGIDEDSDDEFIRFIAGDAEASEEENGCPDRMLFTATDDTPVSDERETSAQITSARDLEAGLTVHVEHDSVVMHSCPPQTAAAHITVLAD